MPEVVGVGDVRALNGNPILNLPLALPSVCSMFLAWSRMLVGALFHKLVFGVDVGVDSEVDVRIEVEVRSSPCFFRLHL